MFSRFQPPNPGNAAKEAGHLKLLKNKWFWVGAFALLFALSIDIWAFDLTEPSLFGLPYIVLYVIVLETALFVLFALFARFFWTEEEGEC